MFERFLPKYASENSDTCSEIKKNMSKTKHKNTCSKLTHKSTKAIGKTYYKLAIEKPEQYHLVSILLSLNNF